MTHLEQQQIYAVANFGNTKLVVCKAYCLSKSWFPVLHQLNEGQYPHPYIQREWNQCQGTRRFTFHLGKDLQKTPYLFTLSQLLTANR